MGELLSCPFCGGEASLQTDKGPTGEFYGWVGCGECDVTIGHCDLRSMQPEEQHPVELWNTRANTPTPASADLPVAWRTDYVDMGRVQRHVFHETEPHPAPLTSRGEGHSNVIALYAHPAPAISLTQSEQLAERDARIVELEAEIAALREAVKCLRNGYADAEAGLKYVLQEHGRLSGVGFDRVFDHFFENVTIPECEGLLAGSHVIPAVQP